MDKVIEAAARNIERFSGGRIWGEDAKRLAGLAIKAADAARAEDVRAAVERLIERALDAGWYGEDATSVVGDRLSDARRDLFDLLGITEPAQEARHG